MGISLHNLKNNKRTVTVDYDGDTCKLTYLPGALTPAKESEIQASSQAGDNAGLIDVLCSMIVAWEVLDDTGDPLPITPEIIEQLPSAFLGAILQACREDMSPKPKNGRK